MFKYSHIRYVFSRILALPRHVSTANAWLISTGEMSRVNVLKSTKGKLVKHGYTVCKSRDLNLSAKPNLIYFRILLQYTTQESLSLTGTAELGGWFDFSPTNNVSVISYFFCATEILIGVNLCKQQFT